MYVRFNEMFSDCDLTYFVVFYFRAFYLIQCMQQFSSYYLNDSDAKRKEITRRTDDHNLNWIESGTEKYCRTN